MHNKTERKNSILDLRGLDMEKLRVMLSEKRQALELEVVKNKLGRLESPIIIRKMRRDVARVLTAMSQIRITKD